LRLNALSLPAAVSVALLVASCAAPVPKPQEPPPDAIVAPAPAPAPEPEAPPAPAAATQTQPVVTAPFPSVAGKELEPLPPAADDLWARIRRGYVLPELDDPLVAKWEQWYASRPDYVARMVDRSRRYLYYIVVEVERRGMPAEIALLPMVESAYNPTALSTSRASGIWQFIPSTATTYGLKQNWWFDSRRDVIAATGSALNYLQKLYGDFSDWQLALAAYNWGEGNVAKSLARNQAHGLPTRYADIGMPDETRNYLPKLQAVKNIVRDPQKYGLELGDIPDAPYFVVVKTKRKMDVKMAASLAEMPLDEFQYLNPQHNRPVIAGADETTILLPIDKAELFAAKLELVAQPLVSWQAYRLRAGETLPQIAAKFGMSVEALRAVNGIGAGSRVPVGHTLLVPAQQPSEASAATLTNAVFTTVPQGRTFYYRVMRGDTLGGIAYRYAVAMDDVRRWNSIPQGHGVTVGQRLRITSDLAPNAAVAKLVRASNGSAKKAANGAVPAGAAFVRTSTHPAAAKAEPQRSAKSTMQGSPRAAAQGSGKSAVKSPTKAAAQGSKAKKNSGGGSGGGTSKKKPMAGAINAKVGAGPHGTNADAGAGS
jgi:peptidoglycan lytic transglycosylase D